MKYIKIISTSILALFNAFLFGQKDNNSLLWEISGNGLTKPSYLYGTVHMIDKKDFIIRPAIDSVFKASDQVALEIDMDDLEQLMSIQPWLTLPEGKTIEKLCSPEEFEIIKKYFADTLGIDIMIYNNYKPFVIYQQLISSFVKGETESFDLYFVTQSMSNAKEIVGLERVEDQLTLFDEVPNEEQINWITDGINSFAVYQAVWDKLITAYINEDLKNLEKLMNEGSPEIADHQDAFLYDRNKKWIPVIESLIHEKSTFIAVGAAHILGKKGVIRLLKKQGYTLTPIHELNQSE